MSSVGLSQVNFDVEGLEDDEEQQLEKEEEERERELHELLSKELPEDLLDDDDNLSFSSHGLSDSIHGHTTPELNKQLTENPQVSEGSGGFLYYERTHPLLTHRGEKFIQKSGFPSDQTVLNVPGESAPREHNFRNNGFRYNDEIANGNHGYSAYQPVSYHGDTTYQPGSHHPRFGNDDPFNDRDYVPPDRIDDFDGQNVGVYEVGDGTKTDHVEPEQLAGYRPIHDKNFNQIYRQDMGHQAVYDSDNRRDVNDNYTVQYTRNRSADDGSDVIEQPGSENQFNFAPPNSELAQLRVLHQARGRKLEELTKQLATKEKDYERQIRLLNHHLALMKGERDGMLSSLKHVQELATERKNDCESLEKKLQESQMEKEQTVTEKDEIQSEHEAAKKTIESLHQQLMELEKSESLSRAREQHENIVMATRKRYEEDVVRLKQKLDEVNNSLLWKTEESKRLQEELMESRKEADRVRLDRADTVNRLTKSLEQSQKQNEELLKAGSAQEISHLQSQLQRTQRENDDLRQHYKTMEGDLVELKEQLHIHESVSKLGLNMKNESISALGTDAIKRNFAADDWKTPQPSSLNTGNRSDEALSDLHQQLQHALSTNRSKREEVEQLRVQLDVVKSDLVNHKNEKDRMEMIMKKQEIKVLEQEKKISDLEVLTNDPEKREEYYKSELDKMKSMIEECNVNIQEYEKRGNELEDLNLQLKTQMSEMVREHDIDQQKSIEQCRQSCLEFHDKAMSTMKEQLANEHEEELSKLRDDIEAISLQLAQAKESYVVLSEETRWIEKQTRERCEEETKRKIEELRVDWDGKKSHEIENLRHTVMTELERNFVKEKASWQKNENDLVQGKIQTELALAKMEWAKGKEKDIQQAVESALSSSEKEWISKYGKSGAEDWEKKIGKIENELELKKENEIKEKIVEMRNELERELSAAREKWARTRQADIEQEVAKTRKEYEEHVEKLIAEASISSVTLAKADWMKEQEEIRHRAIDEAKAEALAAAKEDWEQEKKNLEISFEDKLQKERGKWRDATDEEKSRALETALLVAEQKWRREHEERISEAVREALETVKESWKKERDTAIESAVTQSLQSAKKVWNESKVREIEEVLSAARKQWFTKFDILSINSPTTSSEGLSQETNKTFSYLEARYSTNLREFRETELQKALEEHEKNKSEALKEQEEKHKEELETISKISQEDWDKELKELETVYQNKLQVIVDEMEMKWNEKTAALEQEWSEKYDKEHLELEESYRAKYKKERGELGRELREKYEKGIEHARKKLELQFKEQLQSTIETAKHQWEEEQEEDRLALEEQHLKKLAFEEEKIRQEMKEKNEIKLAEMTNESCQLKEQHEEQKQHYENKIEKLHRELKELTEKNCRQKIDKNKTNENVGGKCQLCQTDIVDDQNWFSSAEFLDNQTSCSKLQQLRRQYLTTTAKLKDDFLHHVSQTRENAAKTIRTEVMKERHATAKRLRKYYLECLKELLENDKEAAMKNQNPRSDGEKMGIMGERLTLQEERLDFIKSQESTLTNSISEHHRHTDQTENSSVDSQCVINYASRDTNVGTRSPKVIITKNTRTRDGQPSKRKDPRQLDPKTTAINGGINNPDNINDFKKAYDTNYQGMLTASSSESLLSLDTDVQLRLPPVIKFRQQELPDNLLLPADASESDSSGDNMGRSGTAEHKVTIRDKTRHQKTANRTKHALEHNQERQTDVGSSERTGKIRTKSEPRLSRPTVKFSAPVMSMKSKNTEPTILTSSLPKPISNVLPSKHVSPINRAPPKFSYTMHSKSSFRKPNID